MRVPLEDEKAIEREKIAAYVVGHLPIIKSYAVKIGLVDIINELVSSKMDVDPGTIFLGMVMDTLSGRTPLYRLDEFFQDQDTELLLGRRINPAVFNDYNVGRVLDKAYEIGAIKIFSAISKRAVDAFEVNNRHVSFDTTSVSVFGDYDLYAEDAESRILKITHGHSKDHRPDLKQFLVSMLCVDRNVPVFGKTEDGNGSDMLLHIAPSTLSDMLHRAVTRARENHRIRDLKTIGIDEVSYCKGHKYATIVYDLKKARVVWIGKGKGRETIDQFFTEALSDYQKRHIQWASCDMSRAYITAIEDHCPNVTLVLDRFHIVKALNDAVDEVRKQQWRQAAPDERKALKGLRWLLFKHSRKRNPKDTRMLNALNKGNRRIHRAWVLKDEFEHFWDYKATWAAKRFLKRWTTTALKSRLQPLRDFVKMIRKHSHRILPYVVSRLTNAVAEGVNRIIKIVKNRASGFRHLNAFSDMIFLTVGDVDIPGQIPPRFRTI